MQRGKLIVIEGGEGCGKTTQAELLRAYLESLKLPVYLGREPGGVPEAEEIRDFLKRKGNRLDAFSEMCGFLISRRLFYDNEVIPRLKRGEIVITDRSGVSTLAYQGYAGGIDPTLIFQLNTLATSVTPVDLGILIDIDPEKGLAKEVVKDRFGEKGIEFHRKVREGYILAARTLGFKIIDYVEGLPEGRDKMQQQIIEHVDRLLEINFNN